MTDAACESPLELDSTSDTELSETFPWKVKGNVNPNWPPKGADPALVNLGQQIYRGGIPTRGIPACIACHGPTGHGNPFAAFPRISWQHAAYVTKSLQDYKSGERASDANQMMRNVASLLKDDEIRALASYVQGLD